MPLLRTHKRDIIKAMAGSPLPPLAHTGYWQQALDDALHQCAGIGFSGDNGTGKSELGRHVNRAGTASGEYIVILLDGGDGSLARDCVTDNLDLGGLVAANTDFYSPGNTALPLFAINPLAVDQSLYDNAYQYGAAIQCRAHHAALMFPGAFGSSDWDETPLMYRVLTAITSTLARLHAPLAMARHFFDDSEHHATFIENLPFPEIRSQFQNYLQMSVAERGKMTGSSLNRLQALLYSSPIMTAMFSRTIGCWSTLWALQARRHQYFDLSLQGNLDSFHQRLIAQVLMADILWTVMSLPPELRIPLLVIVDEAPVLLSGSNEQLLTSAIPLLRKLKMRLCPIWQGIHRWEGGKDNRLLRTIVGQCSMAYFRHTDTEDARFAADQISLPMKTGTRVKFVQYEEEQFHARDQLLTTINTAVSDSWAEMGAFTTGGGNSREENWGTSTGNTTNEDETLGGSESDTTTASHTDNIQEGESEADSQMEQTPLTPGGTIVMRDGNTKTKNISGGSADQKGTAKAKAASWSKRRGLSVKRDQSQGGSANESTSWNSSQQTQRGRTVNTSYTQQYLPVYEWRSVLRFLEFYTLEEETELTASLNTNMQVGELVLLVAGHQPQHFRFDMLYNCLHRAPEVLAEKMRAFHERNLSLPNYHCPQQLITELPNVQRQMLTAMVQMCREEQFVLREEPLAVDSGTTNPNVTI